MSPARNRRRGDAGFSMVEALVALAVFAAAGVALVGLQAQSLTTLRRVETFALAQIVAQNQLTEAVSAIAAPPIGDSEGEIEMAGRTWRWRMQVMATADAGTRRVRVIAADSAGGGAGAETHGFVSAPMGLGT